MTDRFLPAEVTAERMERLRTVVERSALVKHAGPGRTGRGGGRRGTVQAGPVGHHRPHRPEQARALRRTRRATDRQRLLRHGAGDRRRPPPPDGRPGGGDGPAVPPGAHPGHRRLTVDVALVGPTASGKSEVALEVVRAVRARCGPPGGDVELVSVDSMAVYRGMDLGTTKPSPEVRAEVRYHLVDLVDPDEEFTVTRFQAAAREALAGDRRTGQPGPAGRGDRPLPAGRRPTTWSSRDGSTTVAADLRAGLEARDPRASPARAAAVADLHARLAALDPVAAARIEPGNERRLVRALEVTLGSGRPFSTFGPGLERYPPASVALVGLRPDPEETDRRIGERFAELMDAGLLDEVRAPGGPARPACPARPARRSATGSCWPTWRTACPSTRRSTRRCGGPGSSPGASGRGSAATRGSTGWTRDEDPVAAVVARLDGARGRSGPVRDWWRAP